MALLHIVSPLLEGKGIFIKQSTISHSISYIHTIQKFSLEWTPMLKTVKWLQKWTLGIQFFHSSSLSLTFSVAMNTLFASIYLLVLYNVSTALRHYLKYYNYCLESTERGIIGYMGGQPSWIFQTVQNLRPMSQYLRSLEYPLPRSHPFHSQPLRKQMQGFIIKTEQT